MQMHNARASVPLARSPACGRPPPIYTEQALNSSTGQPRSRRRHKCPEETKVEIVPAGIVGPMVIYKNINRKVDTGIVPCQSLAD